MEKEYEELFKKIDELKAVCQMPELEMAEFLLMNAFRGLVPGIDENLPTILPENLGEWDAPFIYNPKKYILRVSTIENRAKEFLRKRSKEELDSQIEKEEFVNKIARDAKERENKRIAELLTEKKLSNYRTLAISLFLIFILVLIIGVVFLLIYLKGNKEDENFIKGLETFSLIISIISIPLGIAGTFIGIIIKLVFVNHKERVEQSVRKLIK